MTTTENIQSLLQNIQADKRIVDILHLADNSLIMGHRLSEWTGHGPMLEQDIAISNIALDLIGQSRNFYQHAATIMGKGVTEDMFAYFRDAEQFYNFILVELPNEDWGQTIMKLFLFSVYQQALYTQLVNDADKDIAAIAEKSLKEVNYHVRWSSDWVIRLGDGTEESRKRILKAMDTIWPYTPEYFEKAPELKSLWLDKVQQVFSEATLDVPTLNTAVRSGGHTEHLTILLAEMQILQRTYPGCEW